MLARRRCPRGVNGGLEGPNRERGRDYRETGKDTLRIV